MGVALAEGGAEESVLLGEVDAAQVSRVRAQFPFLADRR
jgi:hypothetical protein